MKKEKELLEESNILLKRAEQKNSYNFLVSTAPTYLFVCLFICLLTYFEMGSCYVVQPGLDLLGSNDLLVSAS
jgi:hypothetical protein